MDDPRKIIIEPVITEKSTDMIEQENRYGVPKNAYSFKVARGATKPEIREAIQAIFGVRVKSVNTLWRRGKRRRSRYGKETHTPDWKKAIVTLQEGDRIELY
ncbi:MAG: 50S ribosomal protein L23 [Planctomycetota bacterium]